jgi:hypothetical protein
VAVEVPAVPIETDAMRSAEDGAYQEKEGGGGVDAPDAEFVAPEDLKSATDYVAWAAEEDVSEWIEGMASDFNRTVSPNSILSLSMSVERSRRPKPYAWREDLLRGLTCDICAGPYGVYAIALFCPDCGGRNVHVHFAREVELVTKQVALSEEANARDDEELAFRVLGNAHEDVLTALETYLRTIFLFLARKRCSGEMLESLTRKARSGNPFQNLERATALYQELGPDPFRVLTPTEREFLVLHIEKRHVIGHNLGLADERYLRVAGHEDEGENIGLLGADVRRFAELAYKVVVSGIEETEPEFLPTES